MNTSEFKVNQNTSATNSKSSATDEKRPRTVPSISLSSSSSLKNSINQESISIESLDTLVLKEEFLKPKSPSIHSTKSLVKESLKTQEENETPKKKVRRRIIKKEITAKCSFAFVGMVTVFVSAASITMLIYQINREERPNEINLLNIIENSNETLSEELNCQDLKGDGFCDDEVNNEFCNYDGGDCCDQYLDRTMCTDCFCHIEYFQTKEYLNCPQVNMVDGKLSHAKHGDGHCDEEFNTYEEFFDAGDCCLPNPTIHLEGSEWHPIFQIEIAIHSDPPRPCKTDECECIPNNLVCNASQLGDDICQDYNNGPLCEYDLGDCCLKWFWLPHEVEGHCCNCFCHLGSAAAGQPPVG